MKLTEHDKKFGPITYGRTSWNPWSIVYSSGGDNDRGDTNNHLTIYVFGWVIAISMPNMLQPYRIKHIVQSCGADTVLRMGSNWYEVFPREYGFMLNDGHLCLRLGRQTDDSSTEQSWSCFLPWTQWRFNRFSLYGLKGEHIWTQAGDIRDYEAQRIEQESCPSVSFNFIDFDGQPIIANTRIEEREWLFGTGLFKWLSWFVKPNILRSLNLEFSSEVGPEKGSWKGGTLGHGIDMLHGELHEESFRRYCQQEHKAKGRTFHIKFIGKIGS
ncbi:MAG TPA: hypothetical protein VF077_13240 [Nitrospiraceae bacterium]